MKDRKDIDDRAAMKDDPMMNDDCMIHDHTNDDDCKKNGIMEHHNMQMAVGDSKKDDDGMNDDGMRSAYRLSHMNGQPKSPPPTYYVA